jgi:D-serine deaminase-like pyridoxal phosphate-dependent protein
MHPRYHIADADRLFSPSFVVFRDLVADNLDRMVAIAGDPARLRPHCKTHKTAEIVRMQAERGVTRQKAATLAECEMLARAGCTDVLLAYNLVGPNIARAIAFRRTYPQVRFAATADSPALVSRLAAALQSAGVSMELYVDINPGRDRTGVPAGDEAAALYAQIARTPGLTAAGFHIYDGQHHQSDFAERTAAVAAEWKAVTAMRDSLVAAGLPAPRLICGGTPTFPVYARMTDPAIELSPGTCSFHDASYDEKFPDLRVFTPAALVFTRVVSRPKPNRVTFDCGTKSVSSDTPMGQRVVFPDIPDGVQVLHNEEHLVVETADAHRWNVGDWTLAIPRHVCPTTALHRELYVVSGGRLAGTWAVAARDRVIGI